MGKSDWKDMREFIDFCDQKGEVRRITEELDPDWEVNGVTRIVSQELGPLLIFENIKHTRILTLVILVCTKRFLAEN